MVRGVHQLIRLRDLTAHAGAAVGRGKNAAQQAMAQVETLRKMLLAMASDMRVVLVRLASCVTTLRYFAEQKRFDDLTRNYGREVLDLYAPLANRLGIFQLKWELEDLSFRMMEPDTYKRIAKMLEEKRMLREELRRSPRSSACRRSWRRPASRPRSAAGPSTSTASGRRCAARSSTSPSCTTCAPSA
jgi:GTP pyrophosphokinase